MDEGNSKQFGEIAKRALTSGHLSPEQSTKASETLAAENARKRVFLKTFRRWEMLFRRRDGDIDSDRWLIAEYYRALGHLPEYWLDKLTDALIRQCTFFPSIAECLKLMECGRYDYGHDFHSLAHGRRDQDSEQIGTTAWRQAQLGHQPDTQLIERGGEQTQ